MLLPFTISLIHSATLTLHLSLSTIRTLPLPPSVRVLELGMRLPSPPTLLFSIHTAFHAPYLTHAATTLLPNSPPHTLPDPEPLPTASPSPTLNTEPPYT